MDSEFPSPEEEFDLIHQDDYEVLRELEADARTPSQQKLPAKTQNKEEPNQEKTDNNIVSQITSQTNKYDSYKSEAPNNIDSSPSTSKQIETDSSTCTNDNTKKRTYEDLFGDINDILELENIEDIRDPKRPRWNQPKEVIKVVLEAREKFHFQQPGILSMDKRYDEPKRETISTKVPPWNFVALTRSYDFQRIYIRVKNERQTGIPQKLRPVKNLLPTLYNQLKAEAEEIIVRNVERKSVQPSHDTVTENPNDGELWVEKYKPRSYTELLSDETVNRTFLHWLKLWDKIVFNRNYVPPKKKMELRFSNYKNVQQVEEEVDKKGLPIHRIALLSGPPGLGKTTLAHVVAKHAGYNVVEINASDERTPDAFRQVLLASTQMKAVMGSDPRPNCLVLDEIDGAPTASIDLLLKFVEGKLNTKGRKDKSKDKESTVCHRPVICICNEPYAPALRSLRTAALVIPVPEVTPTRLADRLAEIAREENIKVNPDTLLKLAEISACDIRSCLGALQYLGKATSGANLSFALKDSRKGLFDTWKQVLTVPYDRSGIITMTTRARMILKSVQGGEAEKLAQGIFHNYPQVCSDKLKNISAALEWFEYFDRITSLIASRQCWSLMPYTNYAFVSWHFNLANARNVKVFYPSIVYEVSQKLAKSTGILATVQRSCGLDPIVLTTDIAPFLPELLSPRLRTISGHLQSSKERDDIARLVNILLNFGLTFSQERNLNGIYTYQLDPNILEIGIFPGCKTRQPLAHAAKQIIVQELEAERLRRAANLTGITIDSDNNPKDSTKPDTNSKAEKLSNNATSSSNSSKSPKKLKKQSNEYVYKDFFGRPITNEKRGQGQRNKLSPNSEKVSSRVRDLLIKHGVWYKYKEGFSNAVRKRVLIADLL